MGGGGWLVGFRGHTKPMRTGFEDESVDPTEKDPLSAMQLGVTHLSPAQLLAT